MSLSQVSTIKIRCESKSLFSVFNQTRNRSETTASNVDKAKKTEN